MQEVSLVFMHAWFCINKWVTDSFVRCIFYAETVNAQNSQIINTAGKLSICACVVSHHEVGNRFNRTLHLPC